MHSFRFLRLGAACGIAAGLVILSSAADPSAAEELRPVSAFAEIEEEGERSAALFTEAWKVLTHARCVNCHPAGDAPLQRDGAPHEPPVVRGRTGFGVVGMRCETCHLEENFDPGTVPGAPHWHLAPKKMAWEGLSVGEICQQIKDPERNGGRDLDAIVRHMRDDALVAWGWTPGADREPAPGTHQAFGELIAAWARTGAVCPEASAE
jgi:hypothetical protein